MAYFEIVSSMELTTGIPRISFGFSLNHTVRTRKRRIVMQRRRSPAHTFEDQLAEEKKRLEKQAVLLPHGPPKDALLRKIRQLDTAAHMHDWLKSPELRPPELGRLSWRPLSIEPIVRSCARLVTLTNDNFIRRVELRLIVTEPRPISRKRRRAYPREMIRAFEACS